MAKNKEEKTNVMRALDQKKIPYTAHSYDPDGPIDGVSVAQTLGQPAEQVFKPFCYLYLSRIILLEKLKARRFHYFIFKRISANKMNIYKINHFASSITVFIPLIFSPRTSVNNCFILLRRTATKA